MNTSRSDEYRRHCCKYTIRLESYNASINLPPEFDVDPLPNLGSKVNHHFQLKNTRFLEVEHPIWGLIMGLFTTKNVNAGNELFAFYTYIPRDFPEDYPWYWDLKMTTEKKIRLNRQ